MELTAEQYHAQLKVAPHGGFYTVREAPRHMVARAEAGDPGGSIIPIGSGAMFAGVKGMEHYGAAKSGLAAMMRGMATELGKYGIRVNTFAPGYVKTGSGSGTSDCDRADAVEKMTANRTPIPRIGYPEDFEGAAAYLGHYVERIWVAPKMEKSMATAIAHFHTK